MLTYIYSEAGFLLDNQKITPSWKYEIYYFILDDQRATKPIKKHKQNMNKYIENKIWKLTKKDRELILHTFESN